MKSTRYLVTCIAALWIAFFSISVVSAQADGQNDLPELIARVKPAVVTILCYNPEKAMPSVGTGAYIAADKIASARHVFAGGERAEIRTVDGRVIRVKGIVAEDRALDLVIVQIETPAEHMNPLKIAANIPREGERVFAIGSPLGLEWTISEGIVSAVRNIPGVGCAIQHTVPISQGSSGCPIMNMQGEMIGIQTSMLVSANKVVQAGQNLNFAVPGSKLAALKIESVKPLPECAKEVPEGWNAAVTTRIDSIGVRPYTRDDFGGALPLFQESVKRFPNDADTWFRLGTCEERLELDDKAIDAYNQALELNPNQATACNNLSVIYIKQDKYADAEKLLLRALEINPDHVDAHYNLGIVYVHLKQLDKAKEQYDILVQKNKEKAEQLKQIMQ